MSKRISNEADETGRRLISDLIERYNDNPEFRDVYVEGAQDQARIRWFLSQHHIRHVAVYEIDSVHIPMDLLLKYDLDDGQKGRIVALAHELEGKIPNVRQATCIGDSDHDILLGRKYKASCLVLTEYSCHEMYTFDLQTISKFLAFSLEGCKVTADELIAATSPIMVDLHVLRATNQSLKWGMKWLNADKAMLFKNGELVLDLDTFVKSYLSSNSQLKQLALFKSRFDELRALLTSDYRCHISKHDFFAVLAEYLPRVSKGREWNKPGIIAKCISGCVELHQLSQAKIYQEILERAKD